METPAEKKVGKEKNLERLGKQFVKAGIRVHRRQTQWRLITSPWITVEEMEERWRERTRTPEGHLIKGDRNTGK